MHHNVVCVPGRYIAVQDQPVMGVLFEFVGYQLE